jgi:4-carboxymuconolactone decarboxylase
VAEHSDDVRRKGLDKMKEVYGWDMPDLPGDYFALTADHLFADIWSRPGLSMRDKRIMTLSVVTALGLPDLAEIQVNAALHNEEMTAAELREMAIFITHYVGFPLGSTFNSVVEKVIAANKKGRKAP